MSDIQVAADGLAGLEIGRQWQADVIFADTLMPRMNGLEMGQAIKTIDPAARITVIASGNGPLQLFDIVDCL